MVPGADNDHESTLAVLRDEARRTWAAGNYDAVAEGIWEVGERIVARVAVGRGDRVLDVACGTGNAALRAAQAGGRVTGIDITPELFEAGRRRSAELGVEIEWLTGDAEELPFDDGSFDVVLSTFGVMFAPRHRVAAQEIARVLAKGGRIGICSWTPEGAVADFFRVMADHLPQPPDIAESPLLWGTEDHVRQLFHGSGVELAFTIERLDIDPEIAVDEAVEFYVESFGPLLMAREYLEPRGEWGPFVETLRPYIARMVTDEAEYLVTTGIRTRPVATA